MTLAERVRLLAVLAPATAPLACGAPPVPVPPPAPCVPPPAAASAPAADAGTPANDEAARRRLFADLVALVRRYHVFAPQTEKNLGHAWDAELPALEQEFARAADRDALELALIHLGNSLHNPHCGFDPRRQASVVTLDAAADVEWTGDKPVFYVTRAPAGSGASPGDVIESVNGVAAGDLLAHDALRSNANNWFAISRDVADDLTRRSTRSTKIGSHATWTVRPRDGGAAKTIDLAWRVDGPEASGDTDYAVNYERASCAGLRAAHYGPYALTSEGPNFCLYTSSDPRYRPYPIVRYFSFAYFRENEDSYEPGFHRARADHDGLLAGLAAVKGARAVLLDLRDNGGGSNPNWVMDWFAPAPYTDHYVFTKLDDDLRDPAFRHDANMDDPTEAQAFLAQLGTRTPGQEFAAKRPFFCKPGVCDWDNRYTPSHRVTTLPLALLVGPHCVSSCDSFTQQFSEWGFAPLVGEPTATGHTTRRLRREVTFLGETLGELVVAFSYEVSGKSGARVEGVPIALTERVDRTFANRDKYDALLVERAIAALAARPGKRPPSPR